MPGTDNPDSAPAIVDPLFQPPFKTRVAHPLPGFIAIPIFVMP